MNSLHRALNFWLCVSLGFLLVIAGLLVAFISWRTWLQQFDALLSAQASAIITAAEAEDGAVELDSVIGDFTHANDGSMAFYYEIRKSNGSVALKSGNLRSQSLPSWVKPAGTSSTFHSVDLPDGRKGRAIVLPFVLDDDDDNLFPGIYLVLAGDVTALQSQLRTLVTVLLITGMVSILLTYPLVGWVLKRGLRPVNHLGRQTDKITANNLDMRFDTTVMPEELRPVASRLNDLLARLQETFERERLFTGHVAHELRTPLAELQLSAETALEWPEEITLERMQNIHATAVEMHRLVDTLLALSRAQSGHLPVQSEDFDLITSFSAAWEQRKAEAEKKQLHLELSAGAVTTIQSDPVLWNAILTNLLGNAVRYAPENTAVKVQLANRQFAISNVAPDLEQKDIKHLFDSFWRKDKSRSGYGHAGLGLSLVKAYSDLLGCRTEATLKEGKLTIVIEYKS